MSNKPIARTVGFKSGERNVFFHLLTACNLACKHCYINPLQHGTNTLEYETIIQWLRLFVSKEKQSNLILLGGEPTLHPQLADIVKAAKALRYAVTVDTNGYLHHDFLDKITPDELDFLSFSLDGPNPEANDQIRGQDVFATCTNNIKLAVQAGFSTSLIYTVSGFNIEHLHKMPDLLLELGIKKFFIQVIGLRGNPAKDTTADPWQVEPEKWLSIVPEVASEAAEKGLHVIYPKVYLQGNEVFECAGNVAENYFVFPNGRVYQCPLCEDYPIHSYVIENDKLVHRDGLNEDKFFPLNIPEGCVMNKLLQPDTIAYQAGGEPLHRISCCLLKNEILPAR